MLKNRQTFVPLSEWFAISKYFTKIHSFPMSILVYYKENHTARVKTDCLIRSCMILFVKHCFYHLTTYTLKPRVESSVNLGFVLLHPKFISTPIPFLFASHITPGSLRIVLHNFLQFKGLVKKYRGGGGRRK